MVFNSVNIKTKNLKSEQKQGQHNDRQTERNADNNIYSNKIKKQMDSKEGRDK